MYFQNLKNGAIPIVLIDSQEKLISMIKVLNSKKEIAFDTEFDRFKREYGFKLLLLQIFDGETCFLIDPKSIKSFVPLWPIFDNPTICKVLYCGREDVDLLKRNGCNPKNLFDIQKASALCNMEGRSFSSLVNNELGIKLNKKEQTSNWSKRPLGLNQLIYASNDVIYLLKLKEMILNTKIASDVIDFIKEENLILEASSTKDFTPKLSPNQICKFSEHQRLKLLELKVIRDKFAKEFNMPPSNLVADTFLEAIILDPYKFIQESFRFGFSKKAKASNKFKTEFSKCISTIEVEKNAVIPNEKKRESTKAMEEKNIIVERRNLRLNSFMDYVNKKYGTIASILILEGLSKRFCSEEINWAGAKNYQRNLYQIFIETNKQC